MSKPLMATSSQRSKLQRLRPYALLIIASMVANWFVQLGYYIYEVRINPGAFHGERTLLEYGTGVIGDLLVVPLMNAAILYMLLKVKPVFRRSNYFILALCGLTADALLHFFQGYLKLTNWSMPAPFAWDFAGYWHMITFFFQISFVFLFFYLAMQPRLRKNAGAIRAMCVVFVLIGAFLMLFVYDYLPVQHIVTKVAVQTYNLVQGK